MNQSVTFICIPSAVKLKNFSSNSGPIAHTLMKAGVSDKLYTLSYHV